MERMFREFKEKFASRKKPKVQEEAVPDLVPFIPSLDTPSFPEKNLAEFAVPEKQNRLECSVCKGEFLVLEHGCCNCDKRYCSRKCKSQDLLPHRKSECKPPEPKSRYELVYSVVGRMEESDRTDFLKKKVQVKSLEVKPSGELLARLVKDAMALPEALFFLKLPGIFVYAGYYDIIRNPISLAELLQKATQQKYLTPGAFLSDCHLLASNAERYNGPDSLITDQAKHVSSVLVKAVRERCCSGCCVVFERPLRCCAFCLRGRCKTCGHCICAYYNRMAQLSAIIYEQDPLTRLQSVISHVPPACTGAMLQMLTEELQINPNPDSEELTIEIHDKAQAARIEERISLLVP